MPLEFLVKAHCYCIVLFPLHIDEYLAAITFTIVLCILSVKSFIQSTWICTLYMQRLRGEFKLQQQIIKTLSYLIKVCSYS